MGKRGVLAEWFGVCVGCLCVLFIIGVVVCGLSFVCVLYYGFVVGVFWSMVSCILVIVIY